MTVSPATVLPVGAGYGVVIGIGFFFAFVMSGIAYLQNRYTSYSTKKSEEFNTASRSVKPGLIASGIVSAWTWAATLLQSSTVAYDYGIAGPFWYAAGATVQILMFAVLACKVKQNAPRTHTYLEIIYTRYGAFTHWVFICFGLLTNIFVGSQLLLGGSAVVTSLTGMNVYAAIFLIPLGVCVYVVLGGLRATFLCDYSHTLILMIVILYFMFSVYATNPLLGSPTAVYDLLTQAAITRPVAGNQDGSYLTMKSNFGLVFGVIQLCSGMGTVFLDQAYWQRAIASRPKTAVRAYILGGLAWFAIPFGFATTLGLAAVALTGQPSWPTYPEAMTPSEVTAGLAAPFAASALLGKSGAIALLIVLFMAVTSCASAELIAVSSILTFDVFKTYIRPNATPASLILTSHYMICVFGLTMAIFACIWNAIGIDLGWLFLVMGLIIGGAVFPTAFAITWTGQTKAGAISGCLTGLAAGLISWLVTASKLYGPLSVATTGMEYPTLAGNMAAVIIGGLVSVSVSLIWPDPTPFDWEITRAINSAVREVEIPPPSSSDAVAMATASGDDTDAKEKEISIQPTLPEPLKPTFTKSYSNRNTADADIYASRPRTEPEKAFRHQQDDEEDEDEEDFIDEDPHSPSLKSALRLAWWASSVLTIIMLFLVPLPMFLSHYIFSKGFFTAWVVISFLWVFCSAATSIILPVLETRGFFVVLGRKIWRDLRGGGGGR